MEPNFLAMKWKFYFREEAILEKARSKLSKNANIMMLGHGHLPILSFMIKAPKEFGDIFLHHNFVCSLLNDLFGIQARGGCACAGPYAQHLMGIDQDLAKKYEDLLMEDERLGKFLKLSNDFVY